jgi:hypothetical protein
VGGINMEHHVLAIVACYLGKALYVSEEIILMSTMGESIAGRIKLNEDEQ